MRIRRSSRNGIFGGFLKGQVLQVETDECGKAIWDLCDSVRTIDEIVLALREQFDGDAASIQADVMHAIRIMADAGILTSSDDSANSEARHVDLRNVPILIINSEDRPDRRAFMQRQMDMLELPFSFVDGIKMEGAGRGCAQAHLAVLRRTEARTPFLILEDDCQFTDGFRHCYVVPQEADVLYLGVSGFGIWPPGRLVTGTAIWRGVRFTRYGPNYLRVFNMLSGHARLYLSESYRKAVIERATVLCEQGRRMDAAQASLHLAHVVLTPNELACHQNPELGGKYRGTHRSLLDLIDT